MKTEQKMYIDKVHGNIVHAKNRTMAWMLIRNKCHELELEVPTIDKIVRI